MTDISRHSHYSLVKLVIVILWSQWVTSYENAYDLMERRRQYSNDPRGGIVETERYYNRDRYSTHNRNPTSIYSSVRPLDDDRRFGLNRGSTFSGNGYDNLGNGDQPLRSNSFRDRDRYDSFRDYQRFDEPRRYDSFRGQSRPDYREPFDQFRDSSGLYDSPRIDSYRSSSQLGDTILEPIRDSSSDTRVLDSLRFNDRPQIDPIRDSSRFDDRVHIDSVRNVNSFGGLGGRGRIGSRFDEPRGLDISSSQFDDIGSERRHRPSLERRSYYPQFYNREYFSKPLSKSGYEQHNSDKKYQSAGGGKENSGLSTVGSYVTSNEDKNQKKTDSGYHDNKEGATLDVDNKERLGETTRFDKNGGNKSTVKSNRVQKKGHTTKGFASHHHKDETGNSTTFFDESLDEGGKEDFQDLQDEFGSRKTTEVVNGKEDGRFFQEIGGKSGNFGSGILKDNKKVEKDIVANNNKFNNEERFGTGQDHADSGFKTASEYLGGGVWEEPHVI